MKDIVIVVDMQNGFARHEQTNALAKNIANLLKRNIFDVVIATRYLNSENSIYEKLFRWNRLKNEEEQQLTPGIAKYADYIVDKYIYNCINTNFIQRLCQLNDGQYPEKIYVTGVDTDCCVLTVATALFENNIRPIVLTKYCDSNGGSESHKAGLKCLERLIGPTQMIDEEIFTKSDLLNI